MADYNHDQNLKHCEYLDSQQALHKSPSQASYEVYLGHFGEN